MPQRTPGARIERVDTLARVHDQFLALWPANYHRRAVRNSGLPAIHLPTLFTSALVERNQIRQRSMIAEQNEQVFIQRRRAAVSPIIQKRPVFLAEVSLPEFLALHVKSDNLPVAEPRVDPLAVCDRRRRGEIMLFVICRPLARRGSAILPQPLTVRTAKCFHR